MNIFYPFQKESEEFYIYSEDKEGNILDENEDYPEDWNEWHIYLYKEDYTIEYCPTENCSTVLYFGKINSREFFINLIKNIAYPPNINWNIVNND